MYVWNDLIFDLCDIIERTEYLAKQGSSLPISHETNPLQHAVMCGRLLDGSIVEDGLAWGVWARVRLDISDAFDESGAARPHPQIDFSSLEECHSMMVRAAEHARESSRPGTEKPSKPPPSKPKTAAKRRK